MKQPGPPNQPSADHARARAWLLILLGASSLIVLLVALFWPRPAAEPGADTGVPAAGATPGRPSPSSTIAGRRARPSAGGPAESATAEQIVAGKLTQFAKSRRGLAHALARRHGVPVSDDVERFFDAVESGDWNEIEARFKVINGGDSSAGHAATRPPGIHSLWPAIIDAYGAAEQVHLWPATKLLDYGNTILDSLRPGMIYVGGTDHGRWIPELLNVTSEGDHHVIITQNGLADSSYLDYLSVQYGDRVATLTSADSQRAFQEYIDDARKRLQHDQESPNEPKQIRPGEEVRLTEGRIEVSGRVAVMAINEKLLATFMEKNPAFSFALQESFPLPSTYADAVPLGPLMELRAGDSSSGFTAERATQSLDYWRTTADQLLADPVAQASPAALKSYSKDVVSAANLLAAHNFSAEAEQAYRLSTQIAPSNIEAAAGLSQLFARTGRAADARQILDDFARNHPNQRATVETFRETGSLITAAPQGPAPKP